MGEGEVDSSSSTAGRPIHCKAAVLWAPGEKYKIEPIIVAAPRKNLVRIKVAIASICHTDVTISRMQQLAPLFPIILGHEAAGIVESVGEGVTNVQAGDHILPFMQGQCGECSRCKSDIFNTCKERPIATASRTLAGCDEPLLTTEDGKVLNFFCGLSTFSEYTVVHKDNVTKINPEAPLEKACLLSCGVATGMGAAWKVAQVVPGSTVAVFGLGTIGLAALQACKLAGASRIFGVDTNPSKVALAEHFGMTDFINPKDHNRSIPDVIKEMTGGGVDYSFECVGVTSLMRDAIECTLIRCGVTVILGVVPAPDAKFEVSAFTFVQGKTACGAILGGYKVRDLPELVERSCMRKEFELDPFISHSLPFSKINEAMEIFDSGNCLRCVLEMGK